MVCVMVEDCVDKVLNRFDLVLLVGYCVWLILFGVLIMIECDNDKNLVVVLREIVFEIILFEDMKEDLIYLM